MSGKIAIVGAGPSGCYLAQALLKAAPDLEVDLIDALPVPYGLVRYGVAADHQGTKAVARQFARVFDRQGARFFGNVTVGRDVSLDDLRAAYDAVVLAAGLSGDRRLGVPGDDLAGIYGAGHLTRALCDHPDASPLPDLGQNPLIIGNGNVAIDLLRLLAKHPDELEGSDLGAMASDWLASTGIKSLTIVGRSPADQAKFDPVMIKELAKLAHVQIQVCDANLGAGGKTLEALAVLDGMGQGPRRITFRFGLTPVAVLGEGQARAVRFAGADGAEEIACSAVLSAIGFEAAPGALQQMQAPGLYAVGWCQRGPRGTIPENRADALALADRILADLAPDAGKPGRAVLSGLADTVDYQGWCRIDQAELDAAPEGRTRAKIRARDQMLTVAQEK